MIFVCTIVLAVAITLLYTIKLGVGPVPTTRKVARTIESHLPEEATYIVDLGSGWGTLCVLLARHYPNAQVVGYELSPLPYLISLLRSLRYPNVTIYRRDFFSQDLARADLVTCYLFSSVMGEVSTKLERELAPGAFIVTHTFALREWKEDCVAHCSDIYRTPIYCYQASGGQL